MSSNQSKPFILVDGSSYLYRAFHALPPLVNSKGFPTGAVYGVANMLKKLLADYDPENIAVVFDAKGKTFRDDLYPAYKATRSAMPAELILQIEPLHDIVRAMGLPLLMIEGVEADDVIGTLAKAAAKMGQRTLISTGDKDMAQLVDAHITLVNTMSNTFLTPQSVPEKFGVSPELIIDYLTLVGDSVDNVPGVPQVGPKTAVKWLQQYSSLDNLIAHANDITGKVGENFRNALPHLALSKQLVTIKLDVPLDMTPAELVRGAPDKTSLLKFYQDLEFKSWLKELLTDSSQQTNEPKHAYEIIFTEQQFDALLKKLSAATLFAFETETTALDYMNAEIVGLAFSIEPGKAAYIPLAHDYDNAPSQLKRDAVLKKLKPLLENPALKKLGHNIKYAMEVLANHDINLQGIAYDTMLHSYILDSSSNNHERNVLALKYLGRNTTAYEDVAGKGAKQIGFNKVTIEKAAPYAAEDADVTLQLHHKLWPKLAEQAGLKHIYENIEMNLVPVLARMERHGVFVDGKKLATQSSELEARLLEIEKTAFAEAGMTFNINSPKQLQEILFDKLQLPVLQKTPTGQPSTADPVLQELALEYPLPKLIIEYRSLSKLITTYTTKLPEQINQHTGRIHTSYNQTGAATGRLSSSDPNLQNIPVRMAEGRRIRQAFVAPAGYKIVSADYSQIELRIMSHISQDPALLNAFERNLDIHQATAAEVLGIPLEQVTAEQRRSAKAVNFGIIYGMSAFGLAKQLGIDRHEAQDYIDRYFARYPRIKAYMENTRNTAHSKGFVETLSGRRLYLPDINSSQIMRQKAAERAAINAPLQGTAADIIKRAMITLDKWLRAEKIDAKMIMQVHDELVFEVAENEVMGIMETIRSHMMTAAELQVPLLVSIGVGDNWDAASGH
ncbi:MAG: DNA polymerase I [Pseudomonadota bacterium]